MKAKKTGQYVKYFEVSARDNRNLDTLMYWVAHVGVKNYDRVEAMRYTKKIEEEEKDRTCRCVIF